MRYRFSVWINQRHWAISYFVLSFHLTNTGSFFSANATLKIKGCALGVEIMLYLCILSLFMQPQRIMGSFGPQAWRLINVAKWVVLSGKAVYQNVNKVNYAVYIYKCSYELYQLAILLYFPSKNIVVTLESWTWSFWHDSKAAFVWTLEWFLYIYSAKKRFLVWAVEWD